MFAGFAKDIGEDLVSGRLFKVIKSPGGHGLLHDGFFPLSGNDNGSHILVTLPQPFQKSDTRFVRKSVVTKNRAQLGDTDFLTMPPGSCDILCEHHGKSGNIKAGAQEICTEPVILQYEN